MNYHEVDGYLVANTGRRISDLDGSELLALVYFLILESLKGAEDYAEHRNRLEAALRERKALVVDGSDGRAPLPTRLQKMKRPAWWSDDD